MNTLNKGDLVCLVPYHSDFSNPTVGIVLQDWDEWKHGDHIVVRWFNHWCKEYDSHYIQKFEDFGTTTF